MNDLQTLFDQISALVDPDGRGDLAQLEHTLTDGYAQALALEGERWRIEQRIGEVAGSIGAGDAIGKAKELASLAQRRAGTDGELVELRNALGDLRRRTDAVRAAS